MKLKIVSDGTPGRTYVVNAETGEPVKNVRSVTWSVSYNQQAIAAIELIQVPVTLEAELVEVKEE